MLSRIDNPERVNEMAQQSKRAVVIGAGMAGILAGIKLQEAGFSDIAIYEKADRIGGTWRENTYPGLTCDVPSHHYTYTFERNPDWTRHLPPGQEIQDYFERTVIKYGIDKLLHFNQTATRAEFIEGRWQLDFQDGHSDVADILIAATGVLHRPKYPDFKGMDDFAGAAFHSARWDHSVPLDGKRIGVIGNGSTGVQIISALAGRAAHLEHYVRTPQWIMPVENGYFSEQERAAFRDPEVLYKAMNFEQYNAAVERYTMAIIDMESDGAIEMGAACLANLEQSVSDPVLRERLRPDHAPLCKRLIFSPDYYRAIQHPDALLVSEDIERIEEKGIRTRDGQLHELDVIVYATGFHADTFMRPMAFKGRNGTDLESLWADGPMAYLAVTLPDFPNFFMLNGPNGPVGNYSLIDIAERQWHYIAQLIDKLDSAACDEISPSHRAMQEFETERAAAAKETVWYKGGCSSWYLGKNGIPSSWPWSYSRFVREMTEPDWGAFETVKRSA
jgi:cation diffusion facilitator CzcD-associated flavoprotein CzcO